MSPIDTDSFTILQTADVVPIDFFVTETRPTVRDTFTDEIIERAALGRDEQQFSSVAVVKLNLTRLIVFLLSFLDKGSRSPVSCFKMICYSISEEPGHKYD
jgi:hypothetical protein